MVNATEDMLDTESQKHATRLVPPGVESHPAGTARQLVRSSRSFERHEVERKPEAVIGFTGHRRFDGEV